MATYSGYSPADPLPPQQETDLGISTVGGIVNRLVREYLAPSNETPVLARLASAITTTTATTLTLDTDTLSPEEEDIISPGIVIEVDFEQFLVQSYNETTKVVTVDRGWNGTTRATHASQAYVIVTPTYSKQLAFDSVADEIVSLHPSLWGQTFVEVTTSETPVEVPAEAVGVAACTVLDNNRPVAVTARLIRNWPPSATGRAVLFEGVRSGQTAYLTLKAEFSRPTQLSTTTASLNVLDQWVPIIVVGAAARCIATVDQQRLTVDWATEGDQQQASPPGTATSLALRLKSMRDTLLEEARQRQRMEYPGVISYTDPFNPASRV